MGLVVLHSGHYAKIFKALLGTTCSLKWRESNDKARLWNVNPAHPIASGIGEFFEIPAEEMYGEPFGMPTPDELIFISWFTGGEVFRSGATWQRGQGRLFYFRPGHETHPTCHQIEAQRIITKGVRWARATVRISDLCPNSPALEPASISQPGLSGNSNQGLSNRRNSNSGRQTSLVARCLRPADASKAGG